MSGFITHRRWRTGAAALVSAALLTVAGCHSGGGQSSSANGGGTLTIGVDNGSPTLQDNFNPFSVNQRSGVPYMYEPLEYVNQLNGDYTPFLATAHSFTDPSTLTFTLRSGMKWSDGQPITAQDVVFTFNLMKRYKALDAAGVWQHLSSVSASGNTVTFKFSSPDVPFAASIAQTLIVPQHIWSKVSNPVTWPNTSPVVSGPFTVASFTPNQYTLKKNPDCWQSSQVQVSTLIFPALTGNQTSQLQLARGGYDWATLFMPDVQKEYVAKDPAHNKYWFPAGGTIALYLNLTKAPYSSQAFRQALSYGLDRSEIATKAEDGYVQPAAQDGLLPNLNAWLDPTLPNKGVITPQPSKATALFAQAGYHLSGGKLVGANGKQVTMTIQTPNGFSDWLQGAQVLQQQLGKLGIAVKIATPEYAAYQTALNNGTFDASLGGFGGTGSPYTDLNSLLSSGLTAPVGQSAASNYERYKNTQADTLLKSLEGATDTTAQQQDVHGLEQLMYTQVPVISLFYGATWGEYSTKAFTGWPDAANPYAPPAPYGTPAPDKSTPLMIITHLRKS
jgi:peptide/nickel transport system substrate-binding protein